MPYLIDNTTKCAHIQETVIMIIITLIIGDEKNVQTGDHHVSMIEGADHGRGGGAAWIHLFQHSQWFAVDRLG